MAPTERAVASTVDGSTVVSALRSVFDSGRTSVTVRAVRAARERIARSRGQSGSGRSPRGRSSVVRAWADASRTGRTIHASGTALAAAFAGSLVAGAIATLARWSRSSWLYRWLTAEPEPAVVVIDLRETATVGPLLAAVEHTVRSLTPAARSSALGRALDWIVEGVRAAPIRAAGVAVLIATLPNVAVGLVTGSVTTAGLVAWALLAGLALLGTRVTASWDRLRRTRPARLLAAALEPPDPPDR
jgi:hypothetical protein